MIPARSSRRSGVVHIFLLLFILTIAAYVGYHYARTHPEGSSDGVSTPALPPAPGSTDAKIKEIVALAKRELAKAWAVAVRIAGDIKADIQKQAKH